MAEKLPQKPPLDLEPGQEDHSPIPPKEQKPSETQLVKPDPTVPTASTAKQREVVQLDVAQTHVETVQEPCCKRFRRFCYNKHERTFCGRTCMSWFKIISYAIMYLLFLISYFNFMLFISLLVVKSYDFSTVPEQKLADDAIYGFESLMASLPDTVGLSGTPLAEFNFPLIWYRNGEPADYERYMSALDELLSMNRGRINVESKLGPCGQRPYGYGDQPCILVRINRQNHWAVKPLQPNSNKVKEAPEEVRKWVMGDSKKYWLHCEGYQNYDKEHLGTITYYPNPPGFDSKFYPLKENSTIPVVAIQLTNFTLGLSIAVKCSVWYEAGFSSISFVLYISPRSKS